MKPDCKPRKTNFGFTLIELMIVVAAIAILTAIAYPSYMSSIQKSRRNLAQGCLMEFSQWMERNYTTCLKYDKTGSGCTSDVTAASFTSSCRTDLDSYYTFSFSADPTAPTKPVLSAKAYKIQAAPKGVQTSDACGTLTLEQNGTKGAAATDCWRK